MVSPSIVAIGFFDSKINSRYTIKSPVRKLNRFEIELPLEKGGTSYIDSNSAPILPNMIITAKNGQTRYTKFPFKCLYIHLTVPDGPLYDILMNTPNFITLKNTEIYEKIFVKLIKHYNSMQKNEEIILQSLLLELIYMLYKETNIHHEIFTNNSVVNKTKDYIKTHLTEDLSLENLANKMSLSPIYFHNKFKNATGKTLHAYVEEQRIKKAITMLQTTDYSLTKIAYDCGYSSQSYFSSAFKRKMKKSPREYIRVINELYEL